MCSLPPCPARRWVGTELLRPSNGRVRWAARIGRMGPSRMLQVTTDEVYRAILERQPYPVRGLVGFGANLLLAHANGVEGREALAALDFYVHADLFMNPTAEWQTSCCRLPAPSSARR